MLSATRQNGCGAMPPLKAARRAERKALRDARDPNTPGEEDPDLAGIVPGPQPRDEEM